MVLLINISNLLHNPKNYYYVYYKEASKSKDLRATEEKDGRSEISMNPQVQ